MESCLTVANMFRGKNEKIGKTDANVFCKPAASQSIKNTSKWFSHLCSSNTFGVCLKRFACYSALACAFCNCLIQYLEVHDNGIHSHDGGYIAVVIGVTSQPMGFTIPVVIPSTSRGYTFKMMWINLLAFPSLFSSSLFVFPSGLFFPSGLLFPPACFSL